MNVRSVCRRLLSAIERGLSPTAPTVSDEVIAKLVNDEVARQIGKHIGPDTFHLDNIFNAWGFLKSTKDLTPELKLQAYLYSQYREKSEIALTAASAWYGGDYVEFGSHDLYTLRNFLSAYDLSGLDARWPDTRFYGFDIFGKIEGHPATLASVKHIGWYFDSFTKQGDMYEAHMTKLREHGLHVDRCKLIQGFFQDTFRRGRRTIKRRAARSALPSST